MTNYSKTKEIQGFIIKEQPYKGSQKLFKVFTQQGIISVISGSRIASNIHLFSEVKLLVSAGYGDLYFLKE
ncbi:MAG: hypothetical protein U9Q15_02660 [Patescibacteria group bacterium]|nr:hypothetical protein [Patescibacteria group bacterium]